MCSCLLYGDSFGIVQISLIRPVNVLYPSPPLDTADLTIKKALTAYPGDIDGCVGGISCHRNQFVLSTKGVMHFKATDI